MVVNVGIVSEDLLGLNSMETWRVRSNLAPYFMLSTSYL